MPNLDGTGPRGQGPRTGRGAGDCNEANQPRPRSGFGLGGRRGQNRGAGRGQGRGFRWPWQR